MLRSSSSSLSPSASLLPLSHFAQQHHHSSTQASFPSSFQCCNLTHSKMFNSVYIPHKHSTCATLHSAPPWIPTLGVVVLISELRTKERVLYYFHPSSAWRRLVVERILKAQIGVSRHPGVVMSRFHYLRGYLVRVRSHKATRS